MSAQGGSSQCAEAAVELSGVTYRFGAHRAVDDLDLTVERGEIFGLLGPNGAGKTTTIRLLNTLLPLQEGTIHVFGLDVRRQAMMIRRLLGYVPQQLSIEGALTGRENVAWFARLYDVPRRERAARVAEVLETVDLAEHGMTVVLTTHYMEEADALCDRVALMHRGKLRAVGTPGETYRSAPRRLVSRTRACTPSRPETFRTLTSSRPASSPSRRCSSPSSTASRSSGNVTRVCSPSCWSRRLRAAPLSVARHSPQGCARSSRRWPS